MATTPITRWRRTATLAGLATAAATLVPLTHAAPAQAAAAPTVLPSVSAAAPATARPALRPWPGHPDRHLVAHVVRRGDTATGLAKRYRAWTRELIALNHLGRGARLHAGKRILIPVVTSVARAQQPQQAAPKKPAVARPAAVVRPWRNADMSREQVRDLIVRTAKNNGVPPRLALAVAWHESGWRQPLVSSAGAIGVMQVLPSTGEWMRLYAGRPLQLHDTRDNVLAGVLTLKVLRASTRTDRRAIAAYYQGLGAVRRHGLYQVSHQYVANVQAVRARLARTGHP